MFDRLRATHLRLALGLVSRVPALAPALGRMMAGTAGMLSDPVFRRGLLRGALFYVFAYSASWLLARDLAPQASPLLLLVLPVIPLLGNLPIAFGGLGLREHVSATLFTGIGLGPAVGTAFSLTWFATVTLVPALVGLVLLRVPGVHGSPQPRGMEAR